MRRIWITGAAAICILALPGAAGVSAAAATATAGTLTVVNPRTGAPLRSGGSATQFVLELPSTAACPGDTYTHNYILYSYVIPESLSPASLTYKSGYPANGVDLIDTNGDPWVAKPTGVGTGAVSVPSWFSWALYAHDPSGIKPGQTYNMGISCSLKFKTVSYWNTKIRFLASTSDTGGFTWQVVDAEPSQSGGSSTVLYAVIGVLVAIAVLAGAIAVRFWRRRILPPAEAHAKV